MSGGSHTTLMFPVADAVHSALIADEKKHQIVEAEALSFKLTDLSDIDLDMKPLDSFINMKQREIGVLFHVSGDMYLLLTYGEKVSTLCMYLLDAKKMKDKKWRKVKTPKKERISSFVRRGRDAIVEGWMAKDVTSSACKTQKWESMDIERVKKLLGEDDDDTGVDDSKAERDSTSSANDSGEQPAT